MNWISLLVAALIPLAVGFVWYSRLLFAKSWQKSVCLSDEQIKQVNMPLVFGLTFVFSFFMAMIIQILVIHQYGIYGVMGGQSTELWNETAKTFLAETANNFRTFKHGALHGVLAGVFLVFPITAINYMFSRRSWRLILIDSGYWALSFTLMGGLLCAWQ